MKKISIHEIAQMLGVSATTVSRAISGKGRVAEATKERVFSYLEENELEPIVRNSVYTKKRKTKNILITVAGEKDYALLPYFSEVLIYVYDYFQSFGYQIMFAKTSANDISALENVIRQHKCDGVILTRTIDNALDIKFLKEKGVPFVVIGTYDDNSVYQVDVDWQAGCRELTKILLNRGIRSIALFCADRTHIVTKNRMKGFLKAYDDIGIDFNYKRVFENCGYDYVAEKYTEQLLKDGIECIICMDDNICVNVLNILRKYNVKIPEQIKIASFYNNDVLKEYNPTITCVELDIKELAITAAKMLHNVLTDMQDQRKIMLSYKVLLKESTGDRL